MYYNVVMVRGFSLKTGLHAVFYAFLTLIVSVCVVDPIPLEEYVEDEKVISIVEKGMERVKIHPNSDGGLTAGNGKITGLDPNKYYMVDEWDENNVFIKTRFVTAAGVRSDENDEIEKIGRTTEVAGLTNHNTYKVKSATPLESVSYYEDTSYPPTTIKQTEYTDGTGKVTLLKPTFDYYIDISDYSSYDIVKIPVSTGTGAPVPPVPILQEPGTEIDYIFVKDYNPTATAEFSGNFEFIRIRISNEQDLTININPIINIDKTMTFNPSSFTFTQTNFLTGTTTITIELTDTFDSGTVKWMYGDTELTSTGSADGTLILDFSTHIDLLVLGEKEITVIADFGGVSYSGRFTLKIE